MIFLKSTGLLIRITSYNVCYTKLLRNADYKLKQLKITRNGNEHYISNHLSDEAEIENFQVV